MEQYGSHMGKEAMFYDKSGGGLIICGLCPRRCSILPGGIGACLARHNEGGTLYSLNYAKITSISLDPIEKKPLKKFHPGAMILSAGSFGCNFTCPFCQNYAISQSVPQTLAIAPDALVRRALAARNSGNIGIAYTYNEPIIWYEYVKETSELAQAENLLNVLVTNGYINAGPLEALLPYIAAMNIDLKGGEDFYKRMCGGDMQAVLNTIKMAHSAGCHVEITNLLVSGWNDNAGAVEEISSRIAAISDEIPLHLSRFFPRHNMQNSQPTDTAFTLEAVKIASAHLKFVYPGNI